MVERNVANAPSLTADVLRDKMKNRFFPVILLIITLTCGCFDTVEYDKLASGSSVVTLCKNHVKDGMIWAEISEIWRDESNGTFTNKVADTLETHVPSKSQEDCGIASIMFYGETRGSLINYHTLYVHNGKVSGDVTVETIKSMIRDTHYSGKELDIPCRTSGDTERR